MTASFTNSKQVGHFPGRLEIPFKTWGQTLSVYFLPAIEFSKNWAVQT